MYKFVVGFACILITFGSCTDKLSETGLGILPTGDIIKVAQVTETNIKSFTVTDEKQRTDKPAYNLLGTFNDSVFGKTTADFACQFRLSGYPDFSKNAQVDSLVLYLLYKEIYGDTVTPQRLKVYELSSGLKNEPNDKYYQDIDLKGFSKSEVLADFSYIPKFELDLLDSVIVQEIAIKLNPSLINKLMAADSLTWSDNDKFLQYFKGLYVEAGDLNEGGTIMKINTLARGSRMVLHYHNSEEDSLYYNYVINDNSARVNRFAHDYSSTVFAANLNQGVNQDSLIFVQTTGGLRSKILIPNLGIWSKLIPELSNSSDTSNLTINKAELIFQVDPTISDLSKMLPPEQLFLAAIDTVVYSPADYAFSSNYFGGRYNPADKTYRFNIAKHMQEVIEKKKENHGFYLETVYKNSTFRRAVLKGATSKTGIRLEITYSKIR